MKFFTPLWAILFTYCPSTFEIEGIVSKVFDGDTIELTRTNGQREKIRLVYIDAAEMKQKPWGITAKRVLDPLLNHRVRVEVVGRGYYGRILGEVFYRGESYNYKLIKSALVWLYPWSRFQSQEQKKAYMDTEARNKRLKRGIWRKKTQSPWAYRRSKRGV